MTEQKVSGLYLHYKGILVEVLCEARNSETLDEMVVYKHCGTGDIWVRPKSMWSEIVTDINGNRVERFKPIASEKDADFGDKNNG